jgi:hypothetical protein
MQKEITMVNNFIKEVENLNRNISEKDLRYYENPKDEIVNIYWNVGSFECIYSGDKTMFRHLPTKCLYGYCKTPEVVKSFYLKVFEEMMLNKGEEDE